MLEFDARQTQSLLKALLRPISPSILRVVCHELGNEFLSLFKPLRRRLDAIRGHEVHHAAPRLDKLIARHGFLLGARRLIRAAILSSAPCSNRKGGTEVPSGLLGLSTSVIALAARHVDLAGEDLGCAECLGRNLSGSRYLLFSWMEIGV